MSVRAKFKLVRYEATVASVGKCVDGVYMSREVEARSLIMAPVIGPPDSENGRFFAATPSGEIRLGVVAEEAWSQFELGKEYYLDFTPAVAP